MADTPFPFSVPVDVYIGAAAPYVNRAEWVTTLSTATQYSLACLQEVVGGSPAGIYVYHNNAWHFCIPYDDTNDYIISGGNISIYLDLTADATATAGSKVYRNGVLDNVTDLTASPNVIWSTILSNPTEGAGNGTVTSVGVTVPTFMSVSGSPVTTAGSIDIEFDAQLANSILAGPSNGTGAPPTFRALVPADLPIATASANGSVKIGANINVTADGTISVVANPSPSSTVPAANSGTGAVGTSANYARADHVHPAVTVPVAASPTAKVGTTAVNGSAATFMRSDAAPPIDLTITPTWAGKHTFSAAVAVTGGTTTDTLSASGTITAAGTGNNVVLTGSAASGSPAITTSGTDSNVTLTITPKGSGGVVIGGSNSLAVTGSINTQGSLNSTANTAPAGPTNTGVAITAAANNADVIFFDSTQSTNNRSAEWIFFQGALQLRFKNDAGSSATPVFAAAGGQASGITGITSNSGTGKWIHTGDYNATGTVSANGTGPAGTFPGVTTPTVALTTISNKWPTLFLVDPTQPANNRTVGWQFINGSFSAEMWSDTGSTPVIPLSFAGGQGTGITGITSNSGSGSWVHTGQLTTTGPVKTSSGYTVATLPTATTALTGARAYVTDAAATPAFLGTATGGGSIVAPVFCNGTGWVYG
jgi:hypothetical protein